MKNKKILVTFEIGSITVSVPETAPGAVAIDKAVRISKTCPTLGVSGLVLSFERV